MAQEQGAFAFGDVVAAISDKMVRRHPHVFGDAVAWPMPTAQTVGTGKSTSAREREAAGDEDTSALAGIAAWPAGMAARGEAAEARRAQSASTGPSRRR